MKKYLITGKLTDIKVQELGDNEEGQGVKGNLKKYAEGWERIFGDTDQSSEKKVLH